MSGMLVAESACAVFFRDMCVRCPRRVSAPCVSACRARVVSPYVLVRASLCVGPERVEEVGPSTIVTTCMGQVSSCTTIVDLRAKNVSRPGSLEKDVQDRSRRQRPGLVSERTDPDEI